MASRTLRIQESNQNRSSTYGRQRGFTIVELLVVVIVIGILATISVVTYSGVQTSAAEVVLKSDLKQAATQLDLANAQDGHYPDNQDDLKHSEGTVLEYSRVGNGYCITASTPPSDRAFFLDQSNGTILEGTCDGHSGSGTAALAVTSPHSLPTAYMMGDPYSYTVTTNSEDPVTFSISGGSLPAGLSFNTNTGAITGEPTGLGQATFTVTVTSGEGSASKEFIMTGHPFDSCNDPLPSSAIPTFVGQALRFQIYITLCGQSNPMSTLPTMAVYKQTSGGSSLLGIMSNGYLATSARPADEVCNGLTVRYVLNDWVSDWIDVPGTGC